MIQEASQTTMEIHDDNPDHFEFVIRHIYTQDFDAAAIDTLAVGDCVRRVTIPLGIYLVADKYNMPSSLLRNIVTNTETVLCRSEYTLNVLLSLVPLCYGIISKADHPFGIRLAKEILRRFRKAISSNNFANIVKAHPVFGADVALLLRKEKVETYCEHCEDRYSNFLPDAMERMKTHCLNCSEYTDDLFLSTSVG